MTRSFKHFSHTFEGKDVGSRRAACSTATIICGSSCLHLGDPPTTQTADHQKIKIFSKSVFESRVNFSHRHRQRHQDVKPRGIQLFTFPLHTRSKIRPWVRSAWYSPIKTSQLDSLRSSGPTSTLKRFQTPLVDDALTIFPEFLSETVSSRSMFAHSCENFRGFQKNSD